MHKLLFNKNFWTLAPPHHPQTTSKRGFYKMKEDREITISSSICLSAGAIEWQPCFFATKLLLYAPPKVTSVLLLFVIFGGLFINLLYR